TTGLGPSARQRAAIGVDGEHGRGSASGAEREPAFARADVGHAKSAEVETVGAKLDLRRRPEIPETAWKGPPGASRTAHLRPEASHRCGFRTRRGAVGP